MKKELNFVMSILVCALAGLLAMLAVSFVQQNHAPLQGVAAVEKRAP